MLEYRTKIGDAQDLENIRKNETNECLAYKIYLAWSIIDVSIHICLC